MVVPRIGAEPPIAIIGVASPQAFASPVTALAVPGPDGVMQMPGLPVTRAYACAIIAAACSWRT